MTCQREVIGLSFVEHCLDGALIGLVHGDDVLHVRAVNELLTRRVLVVALEAQRLLVIGDAEACTAQLVGCSHRHVELAREQRTGSNGGHQGTCLRTCVHRHQAGSGSTCHLVVGRLVDRHVGKPEELQHACAFGTGGQLIRRFRFVVCVAEEASCHAFPLVEGILQRCHTGGSLHNVGCHGAVLRNHGVGHVFGEVGAVGLVGCAGGNLHGGLQRLQLLVGCGLTDAERDGIVVIDDRLLCHERGIAGEGECRHLRLATLVARQAFAGIGHIDGNLHPQDGELRCHGTIVHRTFGLHGAVAHTAAQGQSLVAGEGVHTLVVQCHRQAVELDVAQRHSLEGEVSQEQINGIALVLRHGDVLRLVDHQAASHHLNVQQAFVVSGNLLLDGIGQARHFHHILRGRLTVL